MGATWAEEARAAAWRVAPLPLERMEEVGLEADAHRSRQQPLHPGRCADLTGSCPWCDV